MSPIGYKCLQTYLQISTNLFANICKHLQTYLQISTNLSANICKYLQMADRQNVIKGEYHSPKAVHSLSESCTIHYYYVTYYFDLWISEINTVCTNLSQSLIHAWRHSPGIKAPGQGNIFPSDNIKWQNLLVHTYILILFKET